MPITTVDVWKDNRMRQNDIFSKPLVHGKLCVLTYIIPKWSAMCKVLTYNITLFQKCVLAYRMYTRLNFLG
jgi:hypothetical protein